MASLIHLVKRSGSQSVNYNILHCIAVSHWMCIIEYVVCSSANDSKFTAVSS